MRLAAVIALSALAAGCSSEESGGGQGASSGSGGQGGSSCGDRDPLADACASGGSGGSGATGGSSGVGGADASITCPAYADGTSSSTVAANAIVEASGLVASRKQAGVLWTHNDSGDGPRLFALGDDGAELGTFTLSGAQAVDWEDLAIGPGPKPGDHLYAGDIGDNAAARSSIRVYRVAEPALKSGAPVNETLSGVEAIELVYPDGKAYDAETLLVDPIGGDLYVLTKSSTGTSHVFRAGAPLSAGSAITLELVRSLEFGTPPLQGGAATTGGDVSPNGDLAIVRTYSSAYVWLRAPGSSLGDAFGGVPCSAPLEAEQQGEAIGFAGDGSGYFTVSEGAHQPLWFFAKQ